MDWQAIKARLNQFAEEAREKGDYLDENEVALCDLIPADPNKLADAEWLKARGWVEVPGVLEFGVHGDLQITITDVPRLWMYGRGGIENPTRITVALFEAALKAGVKDGE